MDIVTHAITGALVAATVCHQNRRQSALVGAVAATFPDLDVLIRSSSDPLLVLEYHRHFTHSLVFAPLGAALAALLLWPFLRRHLSAKAVYLAALTGYTSACLLDIFTSYGTHLLWPFVPEPLALNIIAVVDPVFTLLVIIGLIGILSPSTILSQHRWLRGFGVIAGTIYLGLGALQLHRAENAAGLWAADQHLDTTSILVKPTLGNLVLWRALISSGGGVQALAVRPGLMGTQLYPGERARLLQPQELNLPAGSRALTDIKRFYRFTDGYLVPFSDDAEEFGDVRYAMLPTSVTPLWGIRVNSSDNNGVTEFFTRRDSSTATRQQFLQMLTGKPPRDTLSR